MSDTAPGDVHVFDEVTITLQRFGAALIQEYIAFHKDEPGFNEAAAFRRLDVLTGQIVEIINNTDASYLESMIVATLSLSAIMVRVKNEIMRLDAVAQEKSSAQTPTMH